MTYPEALKSTLIFSNTSTKISFFYAPFDWITGRLVATDRIESGLMIDLILL